MRHASPFLPSTRGPVLALGIVAVAGVLRLTGCGKPDAVLPSAPPATAVTILPSVSLASTSREDTAGEIAAVKGDASTPHCEGMRLELKSQPGRYGVAFVGTLFNEGGAAVTLVEPGDGSEVGWRTPVITWKVTTPEGQLVARGEGGRCGNVNAIEDDEIFTIAPGGRHVLSEWLGSPYPGPGRFYVRVVYDNDPARPLSGLALGPSSAKALAAIAKSTVCRVESNVVVAEFAPR